LVTKQRVIPRHGFHIFREGRNVGAVTSGSLSPILNTGIAMGYVERVTAEEGAEFDVQIRDRMEGASLVKPPFYDTTRYGYSRTV
jgi:aminomethyltransferase